MRPVWGARFHADHGQSGKYAFGSVSINALVASCAIADEKPTFGYLSDLGECLGDHNSHSRNFFVGIEVRVFRALSFGPMDIWIALSAVSVDGQCFIHLLLLRLCVRRSAEEGETYGDHASKNVLRHELGLHRSSPGKEENS